VRDIFLSGADGEESVWTQKVNQLKKAGSDFTALFSQLDQLKAVAAKDPKLKAEYDALMNRGAFVRNQVTTVTTAIDNAWATAKSWVGMSGVGEMGFIPLIPLAVIVGAIAVVGSWNAAAIIMRTRLQRLQLEAAQKAGVGAGDINKIISEQNASNADVGLFGNQFKDAFSGVIKYAAIGIGLYLLLPVLKDSLRSKQSRR
jgi:hypothetical protein